MAKRNSKKNVKISFDTNLPQNILLMGERVEEDKNIYISQSAYKEIHQFTKNKTVNESGGVLVGNVIEAFGKTNIVIHGFVEAKHSEGTPTTLKFTHETWDFIHSEIDRRYESACIVGWIHTHPDFGIFLSEYDKFIQENFFKEETQIAYVVDPIQKIEGFYFWINGKIERCKGFYIFDITGETIDIQEEADDTQQKMCKSGTMQGIGAFNILLGCGMLIVLIILGFISINLFNRMKILEKRQENLVDSANASITYLQDQISILNGELTEYKKIMNESISDDIFTEDDYIEDENVEIDSPIDGQIIDETEIISENAVNETITEEVSGE